MRNQFPARWVSRRRADELKRRGRLGSAILLDHFNGPLLVEPVGSDLGDGAVLSSWEAEYELQPAWILGPASTLKRARQMVGLEADQAAHAGA
jgi:hypothetical protein